ncbi:MULTISPECIES: BlaI/MecI/CopY family transcriptional regulator [Niastella]|uniref:BlaI/MecI/CopY family transcriptional regulator n=1 Tax=Niastella soli TaxID=2821487 RepID=A0ABS3YZK5_9BACT|nr:BlaI/MecI/CopY family transcriptional regulator [Niastella soli]MBO9203259.1 BlaI/MecI/CopY family transcriptional regulator [Niastella soli]
MEELTKAQEEILLVLWDIQEGAVADVVEKLPEPKPAYTTVATVIKVLEKKGYVGHKKFGNIHVYYPVVTKKAYAKHVLKDAYKGLFNNSLNQLVSFFVKEKDVPVSELEELKKLIDQEIKKQKS